MRLSLIRSHLVFDLGRVLGKGVADQSGPLGVGSQGDLRVLVGQVRGRHGQHATGEGDVAAGDPAVLGDEAAAAFGVQGLIRGYVTVIQENRGIERAAQAEAVVTASEGAFREDHAIGIGLLHLDGSLAVADRQAVELGVGRSARALGNQVAGVIAVDGDVGDVFPVAAFHVDGGTVGQ